MAATDDERMQLAATGDTAAFGEVVRTYQARLLRYAERMLGCRETAHDAVQDAFLRLWRSRHDYDAQSKLEGLLLRIVSRTPVPE